MLELILDVKARCNLEKQKMIGMEFDGASSMKLLAKKVKEAVREQATYFHCFAHCNELLLHDAKAASRLIADALDVCQSLYALAGAYPKCVLLFENIQKEAQAEKYDENCKVLRLQSLSVTRWTTRTSAANVILQKTAELRKTLQAISVDKSVNSDTRSAAKGFIHKLSSLQELFQIVAIYEIVTVLEALSKNLRRTDLTAELAKFASTEYNAGWRSFDRKKSSTEFWK